MTCPNVDGHHQMPWRPEQNKKVKESKICSFSLTTQLGHQYSPALGLRLMPSALLILRPLDQDQNLYHQHSWVSSLKTVDHKTSQPRNHTSQFLIINLIRSIQLYRYIFSYIIYFPMYYIFLYIIYIIFHRQMMDRQRSYWYCFFGET